MNLFKTEMSPSLRRQQIASFLEKLKSGWKVVNGHHLEKEFLFEDFSTALEFVNAIGELSEKKKHHPDLHLSWGKVKILLFTHKINGLTENDFQLASDIEQLFSGE